MNLTKRQKEIIKILEDTSEYKPNEYCKRVGNGLVHSTYFNLENDLYYVKFYHRHLKANGNIISEVNPYKKEVYKLNDTILRY